MPHLSPSQWGLVLVTFAVLMLWLGGAQKVRVVAAFLGIIALGVGAGRVMHWVASASSTANSWFADLTNWATGTVWVGLFSAVLAVVAGWNLARGHRVRPVLTMVCAVLLAGMIATGTTGIPALNQLGPKIQQGIPSVTRQLGG
jgi:hypothetical protein